MNHLLRHGWRILLAAGFLGIGSGAYASTYYVKVTPPVQVTCKNNTFNFTAGKFSWKLPSASSQISVSRVINGGPVEYISSFSPSSFNGGASGGPIDMSLLGSAASFGPLSFPYTLSYRLEGNDPDTDGVSLDWTCPSDGASVAATVTVIPGIPPALTAAPSSVSFPATPIGVQSAATTVTVTNTSGGTQSGLTVSNSNAADFALTSNTCTGASLASGASCSVAIAFNPSAGGLRVGTVTVASGAGSAAINVSGTGKAVLAFSPASLNFPGTPVGGTSAPVTITVTNNGASDVTTAGVTTSTADFAATTTCGTIAAGATCTISVTFSPTATGLRSGNITFTSSAAGSPNIITALGSGISGPATGTLTVPATVTFATVDVGASSAPQAVTLTNASAAAVTVTSIVSSVPAEFAVSANTCATVAPGATCSFEVTFTPAATGARAASISVTSNGTGSPQVVAASGTGGAAPTPGQLELPASVALGTYLVGTPGAAESVTVTNVGGAPVTISGVASSAPTEFAATVGTCATVAPGASCALAVTFTPAAEGVRNATLTVTSTGVGSPQTVAVTGNGVAPSAPGQLSMPGTVDAGSVAVGSSAPVASITIHNIGSTPVTVASIVSSNTAEFAITQSTCTTLPAGATCTVEYRFAPTATGVRTASFTVTSDGVGSPQSIALRGTGSATVTTIDIIEYYHKEFDHYFITGIPDEISKLDAGMFEGWARTGYQFKGYPVGSALGDDVCRFFNDSFGDKSSHFYTSFAKECQDVQDRFKDWKLEGLVFSIPVPAADGTCAAGTVPVYRLYNQGQGGAPNHRYTIDLDVRAQMIAKGWLPEGLGVGVTMCAPQ